jgi:D-alanyl-D-alanine carboxypeptidase
VPDPTTAPTEAPTEVPTEPPKIVGWYEADGKTYYYTEEGEKVTGWQTLEEKVRYFDEDGVMVTGGKEIDGVMCFFGVDGEQLALVNPWNYVPEWYVADPVYINSWQKVDRRCYDALMEMLAACEAAGHTYAIRSAFRTNGDQKWLFENKIQRLMDEGYDREEATVLAATVIAVPGTSEHELGLAVDLVDAEYTNLDEAQENTDTQKWLMENSWRYGFILRYPNDKSEITGIIYEPWHYRYVGKETAKAIYESGLCMEEFFGSKRG